MRRIPGISASFPDAALARVGPGDLIAAAP